MRMSLLVVLLFSLAFIGCGPRDTSQLGSLVEARKKFQSRKIPQAPTEEGIESPPSEIFSLIDYRSPAGDLAAFVTPDPKDGKKHPAILWITGGDCNSIGDVWSPAEPDNDQSAAAYRQAGIVMMFPSLRGGNNNPGVREGYYGEVDDILAAADFLAKQPYVDPNRIYLGGHSTGGTMVLIVAECSPRFRAVFSFGPADDVGSYPPEFTPFDRSNSQEVLLRSPINWLHNIKTPTFVIEGTSQGNISALYAMQRTSKNPNVHFLPVRGGNHFSILAPVNQVIAGKILQDTGPTCQIKLTEAEVSRGGR